MLQNGLWQAGKASVGEMAARLVSVNVGLPRDIMWRGKTVHTGVWKSPVLGRVIVRKLNIDGDGQGDLGGHGGLNRAVMVYQLDSYRYWERELRRNNFSYGQFGENFTVDGLPDVEVCIGDRYRIGTALFEVSQPRVTCYRLGIRMDEPQMAALMAAHHRPVFYFRVLEEGEIGAGDEIVKVADGPEHMSVAEMDALLYLPEHAPEQLERAHSGIERGMAGFVSGDPANQDERKPRARKPRTRIAERSAASMARIPTAESVRYRAGKRQRGLADAEVCG